MDNTALMLIIGVVVAALLLLVGLKLGQALARKQHSRQLQKQFGPEYERLATQFEDQEQVEAELEARQKRVAALDIHPLSPEEARRFGDQWRAAQAHFVDQPAETLAEADRLVTQVMQARGYPMENFEQRAADISVDHPAVVMNYREARTILQKSSHHEADTEDLRQAMIHYRALFEDLLGTEIEYEKEKVR
jgi:hypothetical protein